MPERVEAIWRNIFRGEESSESERDLAETLHEIPIFSELSQRELRQVLHIAHRRQYAPEEAIVREGQPSAGMYIILAGEVHISRRTPQGIDIEIATMHEGDFFGDVGLLDNAPRTATVIAVTDCKVLGFFRPELFDLIEGDPKLACKILLKLAQVVAARLRFTDTQLAKIAEAADERDEEGHLE